MPAICTSQLKHIKGSPTATDTDLALEEPHSPQGCELILMRCASAFVAKLEEGKSMCNQF